METRPPKHPEAARLNPEDRVEFAYIPSSRCT